MIKNHYDITSNNKFNICDLLLLDHSYLKECIAVLKDDKADRKTKFKVGKCFIDAVRKHSVAEEKTVYKWDWWQKRRGRILHGYSY